MFTIKSAAFAAIALATSFGAYAANSFNLNTLAVPSSTGLNTSNTALVDTSNGFSFSDTWSFTTGASSTASLSLANEAVLVSAGHYAGVIENFYATLDGHVLSLSSAAGTDAGYTTLTQYLGLTQSFQLGLGQHSFTISGLADNQYGAVYTGSLNLTGAVAAPVPEPESYAMLLAGLGLMGTIAKRRKVKQA